jgi:tripartite-type tricarboxylate transporter receptor subunit TctC
MESRLGQPIIVEHKPGGKQIIAVSYVVKAAPDGYTLLLGSLPSIIMNPIMNPTNLPYDVERDLVPVTRLFDAQLLLVTSTPAKTVAEFVDYLKANPGKANYASFGLGSTLQVEAELFLKETGTTATEIPFGGSAPALNALLSGSVQFMFDAGISSIPHVKAGKLNLLAQTGATRDPTLPDTPTMAEAGFPAAEVVSWWGIFAPAKTPRAIVDRLNKEFELATKDPAVVKLLRQNGIEPRHTTPEGFSKFIKQEDERVKNIIRTTGLKLN